MKKTIYVLALIAISFSACKNDKKQADSTNKESKEMQMDANDGHDHDHGDSAASESTEKESRSIENTTQKSTLTAGIIDAYLQLNNALTEDSKDKAAEAAKVMLTALSNFDMSQLTEAQHKEYMEIAENSTEHAEHIVKSPIDHQREHFEELSIDLNDLIALVGTDKTLYQNFCPMYNKGKGAIWLSATEDILNPYMGTKMLKCGKTQKKIN
jgi:Protein of unknown function (DUF3347)